MLIQPRMLWLSLLPLAHVQLAVCQDPGAFPTKLLPSQSVLTLYHCKVFFLPRCRSLYLSRLNLTRFILAHSFSLFGSLWMAVLLSTLLNWCCSLVSSAKLTKRHSVTSFRSLAKLLNRLCSKIDLCITLLVAGVQVECISLTTTLWAPPSNQ